MSEKWRQYEICIVINDKSQDSMAKHLSSDGLLYYKCITQLDILKTFTIREHLAKLQAKWFIVSYIPFAVHFCPQRCRICQISKIVSVLRTETVTSCYYASRQINASLSLLSTNIKL